MKLLKEPLLHFLLLGGALFLFFEVRSAPSPSRDTIVITPGKVEQLVALYEKTWQRPPQEKEVQGLIDNYVREEMVYREGVAMGLDQNDTIVRRRVRQKFEFLVDDIIGLDEASDKELQTYLSSNPDPFILPARYTFQQVLLKPEKHGTNLQAETEHLLAQLAEPNADASQLGDATLLQHAFENVEKIEVIETLGRDFAEALDQVQMNHWEGPISSSFGIHLVFMENKEAARLPPLQEIRPIVLREWEHQKGQEARETYFKSLEEKYTVVLPE